MTEAGVSSRFQFAEIGEAGREAVIPLENNTAWITQLAKELKSNLLTPLAAGTQVAKDHLSYNDAVKAFKEALKEMKIELDDEEMGNFVEKTVVDAIYT